ncbi:RNA polymerase, sigma 54 subunit, RpoN/SigL [Bhargavaea ginsengi]|uniref:RNA polymerase, sigma 54 subunit, RpoN/SigL n=1 Tax=Bhargavaea ginsengi TaxID=426757 RepID=A0A1H6U5H9_9BACL|nr:RNA polymerase factor sigma-54 [Bhargavaea ginsengi]MCM3087497.1 RNA polymerase factor sigma-54 [Bhargavaea ginsengi]SEI87561.1 RNA polymerase, sigma 54 subunit, RpoN/SigL [Bhargavaea ginsengi]
MQIHLTQRQEQQLIMTTELRQSIELLQMNQMELTDFLQEQEMENPLIELEYPDTRMSHSKQNQPAGAQGPEWIEQIGSEPQLGRRELLLNLEFTFRDSDTIRFLAYLIGQLDDNGYLQLSSQDRVSEEELSKGIRLLQKVGPPGIGARNLQECLLLQLESHDEGDHAKRLIRDHFELLTRRKWNDIARSMEISMDKVKEAVDQIRSLNPKPCELDASPPPHYVIPDVWITLEPNGDLTYRLNGQALPRIRLNTDYLPLMHQANDIGHYLQDRHKQYNWLLKSLEQRQQTLSNITQFLMTQQSAFFRKGELFLKPLTMGTVADALDIHESTVSRTIKNKTMQTPVGLINMNDLFSSALNSSEPSAASSTQVKSLLKDYVLKENKAKPLSDQKLSDLIKSEHGISVSRRTVAKYREELDIPSSGGRKEIG